MKAAIEPAMASSADINAQLQTLTELVRRQTETYSAVVKSQAELIERLGRAVQDADQRIVSSVPHTRHTGTPIVFRTLCTRSYGTSLSG